jgi:hypothetical protein
MYKSVDTFEKRQAFNQIWMECWKEKGYELEFEEGNDALQFLFMFKGKYVGTLELKHFQSQMNDIFPFFKVKHIQRNANSVLVIDKLSILKEYRGEKILGNMLILIAEKGNELKVKNFIALIEPKFYIALRRFYKAPIVRLGEQFWYKGDYVVPISFDPSLYFLDKEKYSWCITEESGLVK